jgi:hypothetical protein
MARLTSVIALLSAAEIARDMEAVGGAAVAPSGKLASTWGKSKKSNEKL